MIIVEFTSIGAGCCGFEGRGGHLEASAIDGFAQV